VLAGRANGIADHAIGIIGALEPGRVRLDEGLEEGERGRGILVAKLALHLVEPAFEGAAELAGCPVAVELAGALPCGQGLLEASGEFVGLVG
jgi:hypothetical protein